MYLANPACAAHNSVWVLPTASFDLEHARVRSGWRHRVAWNAHREDKESASPPERAALEEIAASSDLPAP